MPMIENQIRCHAALQIELCMDACVSEKGTAAVVDGSRVLLTPLQRVLVPPPMCAVAAVFPNAVQSLAFGEHEGCEVRAVTVLLACLFSCLQASGFIPKA